MGKQTNRALTISLPPSVVAELDRVRHIEHRTRSDVVCAALRQYMATIDDRRRLPLTDPEPEEKAMAQRGRAAIERGEFIALDDLLHELGSHR